MNIILRNRLPGPPPYILLIKPRTPPRNNGRGPHTVRLGSEPATPLAGAEPARVGARMRTATLRRRAGAIIVQDRDLGTVVDRADGTAGGTDPRGAQRHARAPDQRRRKPRARRVQVRATVHDRRGGGGVVMGSHRRPAPSRRRACARARRVPGPPRRHESAAWM